MRRDVTARADRSTLVLVVLAHDLVEAASSSYAAHFVTAGVMVRQSVEPHAQLRSSRVSSGP